MSVIASYTRAFIACNSSVQIVEFPRLLSQPFTSLLSLIYLVITRALNVINPIQMQKPHCSQCTKKLTSHVTRFIKPCTENRCNSLVINYFFFSFNFPYIENYLEKLKFLMKIFVFFSVNFIFANIKHAFCIL